ncbi:MAG: MTH938/NDUFAF3 family protein [Anaerolineales bacterium]
MFEDHQGPIESFDWGRYVINGEIHSQDGEGVGKDICIIDGVVRAWAARKGHRLKPKMVQCVFGKCISILVIGIGVQGAIHVPQKTYDAIKDAGITRLIIEKTPEACGIYNRLVHDSEKVALLAHGTC